MNAHNGLCAAGAEVIVGNELEGVRGTQFTKPTIHAAEGVVVGLEPFDCA